MEMPAARSRARRALLLAVASAACNHANATPPPTPPPIVLPAPVAPVAPPAAMPDEESAAVPISPGNPTWGSRLALVTIVEYADFQCPFSMRVEPALAAVRETYGPDKVRIVWKNNPLPFHTNALPAAEAAMGVLAMAGSDAFWRFHDLAFQNRESLTSEAYVKWARDAGVVDIASYTAGIGSHQWAFGVEKDQREASTLRANGTPFFFINGARLDGAQPFETFRTRIDQAMAQAEAAIASGTPRARVYAKVASDNWKSAPDPKAQAEESSPDAGTVFKVPVDKSPARGPAGALVTIVEFGDFQCPFCGRVEPTLTALRAKYGDKIRLVWKNGPLPFHAAAEPAAEAALEVRAERGDAAFWDVHDRLFAAQRVLITSAGADVDAIAGLAAASGADLARVKKAIASQTHKKELALDMDEGVDFQANGTPHFFINGRRLVGAQPQEKFDKIIDEEIAKAGALVDSGTKPADLYATLTRDGKGPPEPEKRDVPARLPSDDPALGPKSAKVSVHEWADFQCPFCARVEPALRQIVTEYGARVQIVWHDMPLPMHPDAPLAAQAAREAYAQGGARAFWAIHDKMFADQQKLARGDLDAYARELKLDMTQWDAALDGDAHMNAIEADKSSGSDGGVSGTPAFLIVPAGAAKGYWLSGAQGYARFRKLIERALTEAK